MEPSAFAPNEMVYREGDLAECMYIVQKGLASNLGRVLSSGHFFGEDMIAGSDEKIKGIACLDLLNTSCM